MKAFLFSGVHGVGKGFFLNKLENNSLYHIYTASALIERYHSSADAGYKRVSNVKSNQETLIRGMKEVMDRDNGTLILDGHLCIFNAKGEVERIPKFFFEEAGIEGIMLLQDIPERIYCRIRKRDANIIDVSVIEQMQREEEKYARELEKELNIGWAIITHECTEDQFAKIQRKWGGSRVE